MKKLFLLCSCIACLFLTCSVVADANMTGDVDGDGTVNASDARLALRCAVQLETLRQNAADAADVDADGKITASDARMILRVSVRLDSFRGKLTVSFIDVGQAESILVAYEDETMLIDGGNVADGETVCTYLHSRGIDSLDYVVCTHAHEDHVGGLTDVMNTFTVTDAVFVPSLSASTKCYTDFLDACNEQNLQPRTPAVGSYFMLGDCRIDVLGCALTNNTDVNNSSVVLKLTYGKTSVLFTGDAESKAEAAILNKGYSPSATLLNVGHHGSDTSTSATFLQAVAPEFAVISCGTDNSYGHPHTETLTRLRNADVITYRTDLQGTVLVTSNSKTLAFETNIQVAPDIPPDSPATPTTYIGNINSFIFHLPTCSSLPSEKNRIYFNTRSQAVSVGYSPCSRCKP